ncbi:MAG: FAD-dependent oxidoreductase [Pseudomonadota bacterium]
MRSQYRVVVIGGGAVGASCLYHLSQAGVTDCLLIEKDELTSGSTWHAAGNIPTYANSWLGMRAGNYAWRLYKDLGESVDAAITYRHTGAFWPAHTQDRMDLYHHLVGVSKSAGFDLSIIGPAEMEAMNPYYRAGARVLGAIHDPYEGDIDPSQLTQALAKGARSSGAEVARFTRVTGIERAPAGEWRVVTDKGPVLCEIVVNAAGFYGSQIAAMAGDAVSIATLEHQYLVTEPLAPLEGDKTLFPLVRDPDIRFYMRRERASLLFGSYGHPGRPAFTDGIPDDFAHQLCPDSPDDIAEVLEGALSHVPLLADAGVQRMVNGPIAYTPDALPLCGPAFGLPNFYHACGIQVGITQSAAAGKAIAEWVTEGETEWDLTAWDPRRFGPWATPAYGTERAVELYGLQYAIPFPHRILASARPVQRTPLYAALKAKGAVFGQIGGWERAFWFDRDGTNDPECLSFRDSEPWRDAVRLECEAVRDAVGVMDHGGFTKYEVEGPGATAYLERVFCGTVPRPGRVKLSYMLTPKGMIRSEATVARLTEDRYLLCGPTLADRRDFDWLQSLLPDDSSVSLRFGSMRDAALLIMGPASRKLLSRLTDGDLSKAASPWMSAGEITVADQSVTALRVSYVGELGWELHLESSGLPGLYDALCEAGSALGLVDFGSYALNAMRLEKAYHAWGADFGCEYTLFDAGLEGFVNFDKPDFVGRDAVLRQQETPALWRFAGFSVEGADADPLPSDPIFQGDHLVGYVTSGGTGFRLGARLGLGYLERAKADLNGHFEIEILGARRRAILSSTPFYDPQNARLHG